MIKKVLSLILVSLILVSNSLVYAAELPVGNKISQEDSIAVSKNIENEIYSSIVQVYGQNRAQEIYDRVMQIAAKSIENRPEALKKEDISRADDWYKDEIIYMFYVDQFGVVTPEKPNTFKDTSEMFDYLKDFDIIGADVVELAPDYDASGVSTAVATKVIRELLMIM